MTAVVLLIFFEAGIVMFPVFLVEGVTDVVPATLFEFVTCVLRPYLWP